MRTNHEMSKPRIAAKRLCLLLPLLSLCSGCGQIPEPARLAIAPSLSPIHRADFHASLHETWVAALKVVNTTGGNMVVKDIASARFTYRIFHKPSRQWIQLDVVLKDWTPQTGPPTTAVFLGIRAREPVGFSRIADDFFRKLSRNLPRQ